jgi:hypothetical protein
MGASLTQRAASAVGLCGARDAHTRSVTGTALKARLDSFGTRTYGQAAAVARASEDNIVTPTLGPEHEDQAGWIGS